MALGTEVNPTTIRARQPLLNYQSLSAESRRTFNSSTVLPSDSCAADYFDRRFMFSCLFVCLFVVCVNTRKSVYNNCSIHTV